MPTTIAESPLEALHELLDERALRRQAGYRNFLDGELDFDCGATQKVKTEGDAVVVQIKGENEETFEVRLVPCEGTIEFRCSCSFAGDMRRVCRHCVCAAMSILYDGFGEEEEEQPLVSQATVRSYLEEQEKESLIMLIMERSQIDFGFQTVLSLRAASEIDPERRKDIARTCIDRIFRGDFSRIDRTFCQEAKQLIDALEELCTRLTSDEVKELVAYAFQSALHTADSHSDPECLMDDVFAALINLEMHALEKIKTSPTDLAGELFARELHDAHDVFMDLPRRYKSILGAQGMEQYTRIAEAEWEKFESDEEAHCEVCADNLPRMMETLAEVCGDLDKLVALRSRDLSTAEDYLHVARTYEKSGNMAEALSWAEKGLAECSRGTDDLRDYLLDLYLEQGRTGDAVGLVWDLFVAYPDIDSFDDLRGIAERVGQWPDWRQKALDFWQQALADRRVKRTREMNSALVEALLSEGQTEQAWKAAQDFGCSESHWYDLAIARESSHPQDAYPVFQKRVDQLLALKHGVGYAEAVRLIWKVRDLMAASSRHENEFQTYLNTLKSKHRTRKDFLALLKA